MIWRWVFMRFPGDQEEAFLTQSAPARFQHFLVGWLFSLIGYNAFLVSDALLIPDVLDMAILVRLGVFTPTGLLVVYLGWRYREIMLSLPTALTEGFVALHAWVAAFTVAMLLGLSDSPQAYACHAGYVAVLAYGNVVQRMRFPYALAFTAAVLLVHWYGMFTEPNLPQPLKWPLLGLVLSMALYTLLTNHRLEREERHRFLQMQRGHSLREQLKASREQLEQATRMDALTGVANRHGFDLHRAAICAQSWREARPLSLVVVDVDHFKAFNDHYGHPAGDECLRLVAAELQRHAAGPGDLVARWGGEEFVLVLADTDLVSAERKAHAMIQAVKSLGIRHGRSSTAGSVTVSAGVATWCQGDPIAVLESLVDVADAALYQAKRQGRNRVVVSRLGPPSDGVVQVGSGVLV